jgi:hypothetical protein
VDLTQSIADLPVMATSTLEIGGRRSVLIVSDRCLTCFDVLHRVKKVATDRLIVWVNARSEDFAAAWLANYELQHDPRILYDAYGLSAIQLGIAASPVVVHTEDGLPIEAWTIPSARQLSRILDRTAAPERSGALSDGGLPR